MITTEFQAPDIIPDDWPTDEADQLTLDTIYAYNPDTQLLSYQIETVVDENTKLEDFTTLTPPPIYDKELCVVKYHPNTDEWEVVDITDPLSHPKINGINTIDIEIKALMRRLITITAETSGLYDMKYAESIRYLEAGSPTDLTDYPFLTIGVDVSSMSATDYANLIIAKRNEYQQKMVEMEAIRSKGKADINAVTLNAEKDVQLATNKIDEIAEIAAAKIYNL